MLKWLMFVGPLTLQPHKKGLNKNIDNVTLMASLR